MRLVICHVSAPLVRWTSSLQLSPQRYRERWTCALRVPFREAVEKRVRWEDATRVLNSDPYE